MSSACSPELRAALASGTTTLAWLVSVSRQDGTKYGFTTHDQSLTVNGLTYESNTAFSPSKLESNIAMSPDNSEIIGILSDDRVTDTDISGGLYDRARIDLWICDWTHPEWGALNRKRFYVGQISWADSKWTFQLLSLKDALAQQVGRVTAPECSWRLGDDRCGVNLESYKRTCTVTGVSADGYSLTLSGLEDTANSWAQHGYLRCKSGLNAFAKIDIKDSAQDGIALWQPTPYTVAVGAQVDIYPGCDKAITGSCKTTFNNILNYGGFPQIPGQDKAGSYAAVKDPVQN